VYNSIRRKVFITFHQKDRTEVNEFVNRFTTREQVFIPKALGVSDNDDFINSSNPEYVMQRIREKYLADSTITIALVGSCTHGRRYVDWELKASLRQGVTDIPNGVMGIILPSCGTSAHMPLRLQDNWAQGHQDCYARYWVYPSSGAQLFQWIEDAYQARSTRSHLIRNTKDMMRYNAKCLVHGETH
jgi:hypothetical protein